MQLLSILFIIALQSVPSNLVTLDDLKWKNRIIVTLTNDEKINKALQRELKESESGINNRDIIYFLISPAAVISNSGYHLSLEDLGNLIHEYYNNTDRLKVLLIGKDGGAKMEKDSLDLDYIFQLIDAMPMRRMEMKSK